jgi:DNA-binding XRE family transcriptional regulator
VTFAAIAGAILKRAEGSHKVAVSKERTTKSSAPAELFTVVRAGGGLRLVRHCVLDGADNGHQDGAANSRAANIADHAAATAAGGRWHQHPKHLASDPTADQAYDRIADWSKAELFQQRACRLLRKRKGWTQIDMAVTLDMNRGHISDIEQGKREVGIITLQVIARGLGTTMSELLRGL